jgi:hypothetical protein
VLLLIAPFFIVVSLQRQFLAIGSIVAILSGFGDLPQGMITTCVRVLWSAFAFLNVDIAGARPGCGSVPGLFVESYWANLRLALSYISPCTVLLPSFYFLARIVSTASLTRSNYVVKILMRFRGPLWYHKRLILALIFWFEMVCAWPCYMHCMMSDSR